MRELPPILQVENLTGGYHRDTKIIENINFCIYPGEIVGLIGLNGAGKSTLMKTILGILPSHEGHVLINGMDLQEDAPKAKEYLGYIPEIPLLYDELTLEDHLRFTAMAYGLTELEMVERMTPLLHAFRLQDHLHEFPSAFSKGMRQKVMILCTFLHDAKLLLVDEPFIGLDPRAYRSLTNLILEAKKRGTGVLVSTHVLDSAERFCDRYLIVHNGRIIAHGTKEELQLQIREKHQEPDPTLPLMDIFETVLAGEEL